MTGSLRKRGRNSWQLRVYLGSDAATGKQCWASTTVHGSHRYATAQLAVFAEQAGLGRVRAGTVADLLDRWFDAAAPRWSASTERENRSVIDHHLKPHLGHLPVARLTTADVDDLYGFVLRHGGPDGAPLAPATVARIHAVLHRAFGQAVRWEWVWLNPVTNASPPRVPPAEIRPPTVGMVICLLNFVRASDPAFFTFLRLAVSTGARRSQLLGLRWGEIDFEHGSVGFALAYVEGASGPVLAPTKTHHTYAVAIDRDTMALLVEHWRQTTKRAAAVGERVAASGFVFSHDLRGERPWLPNWVTKQFIAHRRQAGLAHFRLHDLRHFMATELLAHGVPVPTVSQRLGHARPSTTLNVYAHRIPGADRQAANILGTLINGPTVVNRNSAIR